VFNPGPPIQTSNTRTGPEGANLFIFHIPNEMTNQSMYDLFFQCGVPLSVRIMVEKHNSRSKGYGFVSYDNRESAAAAISLLNGHSVHGKRLKVQHKQTMAMAGGGDPHHQGGGGGRGGGFRGGGGRGGGHRSRSSPPVEKEQSFGMTQTQPPPGGGMVPPGGMIVPGGGGPTGSTPVFYGITTDSLSHSGPHSSYQSAEGVLQTMLPPRADHPPATATPSPRRSGGGGKQGRNSKQRSSDNEPRNSPPADMATSVLPPFPPAPQDDPQDQDDDDHPPEGSSSKAGQDAQGSTFDLSQLGSELPSDHHS
jgi:RNA recognition motif-containing protein